MNKCIGWEGKIRKDGRGFITFEKKSLSPQRYIYQKTFGKIPSNICIRSKCNNLLCINLEHMFLQHKTTPAKERFFNFIDIPNNKNLCWIWLGNKDKDGYGKFNAQKEFKIRSAHRFSYLLHFGDFDRNLFICHTCDNCSCVNPKHLWLGTALDNNTDCNLKGRIKKSKPPIFYGKNNNKTKLTENQVKEIRDLNKKGLSGYRLAKIYKVSTNTIYSICTNKIWRWLI